MNSRMWLAASILPLCVSCTHAVTLTQPTMVDAHATAQTRALFSNVRALARQHVMFGHQDDLAYGVEWANQPGRSDVKEVAGSYPAVYGWDLGGIEKQQPQNLDGQRFSLMRDWMLQGYKRGGVITISWHLNNPVSGGNAWDTTRAVAAILPGGAQHAQYAEWLDRVAAFLGDLRDDAGRPVPVVFRPFHEMSGAWFWWGTRHCTPEEYKRLWQFTVQYLRDQKGLHNLLWAYSTNSLGDFGPDGYWTWYPGDSYVDVLGFDDYSTLTNPKNPDPVGTMSAHLRWLVEQAEARGKIPAVTETGYETIPDSTWWTQRVLAALKHDPVGSRVAWLLVWRNANRQNEHREHYYAPYPGHRSAADFVRFTNDPLILLENELPDLYRMGTVANGRPIPQRTAEQ